MITLTNTEVKSRILEHIDYRDVQNTLLGILGRTSFEKLSTKKEHLEMFENYLNDLDHPTLIDDYYPLIFISKPSFESFNTTGYLL